MCIAEPPESQGKFVAHDIYMYSDFSVLKYKHLEIRADYLIPILVSCITYPQSTEL